MDEPVVFFRIDKIAFKCYLMEEGETIDIFTIKVYNYAGEHAMMYRLKYLDTVYYAGEETNLLNVAINYMKQRQFEVKDIVLMK